MWDTFFGRDDEEDSAPVEEAAALLAPLDPPAIRGSAPSPPIEEPPPALSTIEGAPAPRAEARSAVHGPIGAVGRWAGAEAVALLGELPPAACERVAEALVLWREIEAALTESLQRADAISDVAGRLLSGPMADPEFAREGASLRAGTDQQREALIALQRGNGARARDWILSTVQAGRTWPPAKVARLLSLTGVGLLTLEDLQPRLRSMDAVPRLWVAEAFGLMDDAESGQALLALLRDPDADVRAAAVAAIGQRKDPMLLHALGTVIKRDPDWFVRLRAIQAAQTLEGYEAIGFFHDLLSDVGWWRELRVLDSANRAGAPEGTHDKVRSGVVDSLLSKVQAVLPEADPAHRAWLMEVLGDSGDPRAVPTLSSALHDAAHEVRLQALRALGRIGGPAIVDILIPALKDRQPEVRVRSAEALGDANDFRALEPLLDTLRDENEDVRAAAVAAIGRIWDRKALGPMMDALKALNDPDQKTRDEFQRAMQRMSDPRTVNLVMNMLEAGGLRTRRPGP